MRIKKSYPFGKLSSSILDEFEIEYALRLPEDYRQFLLTHNGGDPSPIDTVDFEEEGKSTSSDVQFFYGLHDGEDWASIEWNIECYIDRIVEGGLAIAGDSCGNQYVLITQGEHEGQIYFWDHEQETDPPSYQNMSYIAANFTEFANKLYEYIPPNESEADRILRQNDLIGLEELLNSGYDVETIDEYDCTMIENAAIKNRPEIIQILFDHGAQLRNALELARKNYEFFEEHKSSVDLLDRLESMKDG